MIKKIFLIAIMLSIPINIFALDIQFITHSSEEQTYFDGKGELRGKKHAGKRAFYVEVVREMMSLMNHPKKINHIPLKRGLLMIQNDMNVALFNVSQTPKRKKRFKWVGPIREEADYFYEMKIAPTGITTLEDAKKVKSICVLNGGVHENFLRKNNFTNIDTNNSYIGCFKMLKERRVKLTPTDCSTISGKLKQAGISPDQIRQTPVILLVSKGYLAFSINIPDKIIQKWQNAFEKIKKSGKYQYLFEQYLLSENGS